MLRASLTLMPVVICPNTSPCVEKAECQSFANEAFVEEDTFLPQLERLMTCNIARILCEIYVMIFPNKIGSVVKFRAEKITKMTHKVERKKNQTI